ncbi:antitoxin VapB family protein [Candidatus Woesearchaeota archaeon]|nr:antitoxin VapB family protein [Candidatus Woesearchaeota archaeon]
MATKTITIAEDAYGILAQNKLDDESFSEEIRRLFSKKHAKQLIDYFGILSEEQGEAIYSALQKRKEQNIALKKERWKQYHESS